MHDYCFDVNWFFIITIVVLFYGQTRVERVFKTFHEKTFQIEKYL